MSQGISHDPELLAVYAVGGLPHPQLRAVESHLGDCARCRAELDNLMRLRGMLDLLPADAWADQPANLVTLPRRRVRVAVVAAAAAVLALALGGGVLLGRGLAGTETPVAQGTPTLTAAPPAGTRVATGVGPGGARLTVRVEPAAGWVRINASAGGIRAGERCRLFVVSRSGERTLAGSWLVSPTGEQSGTNLDGSALIPPADVVAVEITTDAGATLVSTQV